MRYTIEQKMECIIRNIFPQITDVALLTIIQFAKFCIVGLTNTIVSYAINVFVLFLLQSYEVKWDFFASNIVAFLLSVLWSFYWNNRFVFNENKNNVWRKLIRTYIAYGFTGIVLNNLLSWLWILILGISKYIAPLINLLISVPLNYIINRKWAFGTK